MSGTTTTSGTTDGRGRDRSERTRQTHVMSLLAAGVPISLLMDLADARGPHSWEVAVAEGGSADWLPITLPR